MNNTDLPLLNPAEYMALKYIYDNYKEKKYTPYLKDIAKDCEVGSIINAWRIVKKLVEKGYLVKLKYKKKGIRLTYLTDELMNVSQPRLF